MNKEFCLFKVDKKRVIWEVTNNCNYNCKHCCAKAKAIDTSDELNLEDLVRILDELKEFGVEEIYFSGGEPFSRKDILSILKKARANGISCNISTNASLITNEIAIELENLNITKVHISLDSHIKDKFNSFRGGDYFDKTIEKIKLLKKHNIYVRIGTVIWKDNIDELEDMIKFLISIGVDEIVFNWLVKTGRVLENENICVDLSRFDETINKINLYKQKYKDEICVSMHRSETYIASEDMCPAGEKFFYIDPKGYVSPCSWVKKLDSRFVSEKSLKNTSFFEIIKCSEITEFNKIKHKRNEKYKTGCPAICFERNKTYYSKDPLLKEEEYGNN